MKKLEKCLLVLDSSASCKLLPDLERLKRRTAYLEAGNAPPQFRTPTIHTTVKPRGPEFLTKEVGKHKLRPERPFSGAVVFYHLLRMRKIPPISVDIYNKE
jgi:hypothetical protein